MNFKTPMGSPSPTRTETSITIDPNNLLSDGDVRPRVREFCEDRGHTFVDYEFQGRMIIAYVQPKEA